MANANHGWTDGAGHGPASKLRSGTDGPLDVNRCLAGLPEVLGLGCTFVLMVDSIFVEKHGTECWLGQEVLVHGLCLWPWRPSGHTILISMPASCGDKYHDIWTSLRTFYPKQRFASNMPQEFHRILADSSSMTAFGSKGHYELYGKENGTATRLAHGSRSTLLERFVFRLRLKRLELMEYRKDLPKAVADRYIE
jgi:hypothetical protein